MTRPDLGNQRDGKTEPGPGRWGWGRMEWLGAAVCEMLKGVPPNAKVNLGKIACFITLVQLEYNIHIEMALKSPGVKTF